MQTKPRYRRSKFLCKDCGHTWWEADKIEYGRVGAGMLKLIMEAYELGKGES